MVAFIPSRSRLEYASIPLLVDDLNLAPLLTVSQLGHLDPVTVYTAVWDGNWWLGGFEIGDLASLVLLAVFEKVLFFFFLY